mmetsp:Transcript_79958/g.244463  ORF Transcript_79958/g.244463 Transcript_79958/m.244463 type:complete len:390 (+) Transcript_79958:1513-2682(+)
MLRRLVHGLDDDKAQDVFQGKQGQPEEIAHDADPQRHRRLRPQGVHVPGGEKQQQDDANKRHGIMNNKTNCNGRVVRVLVVHQPHEHVGAQGQRPHDARGETPQAARAPQGPSQRRGADQLDPRHGPQRRVKRHQQADGSDPDHHCPAQDRVLESLLLGQPRTGDGAEHQRKHEEVREPDAVRARENAPQRMHLAVRLREGVVQGEGPVHARQHRKPLGVGTFEQEVVAAFEDQSARQLRRVTEQLVPIVVIRTIWGEELVVTWPELRPVFLGVHGLVPLVKDHVVDRPNNVVQEARSAAVITVAVGRPVQLLHAAWRSGQHQLGDEVHTLGHEAEVAGLAPHQQVRHDLGKLPAEDSCVTPRPTHRGRQVFPRRAGQRVHGSVVHQAA